MGSILQVKKSGDNSFTNVPVLRGKSAYEHALDGGLSMDVSETDFNQRLGGVVTGVGGNGELYKIVFSDSAPTENNENIITIVLSGE